MAGRIGNRVDVRPREPLFLLHPGQIDRRRLAADIDGLKNLPHGIDHQRGFLRPLHVDRVVFQFVVALALDAHQEIALIGQREDEVALQPGVGLPAFRRSFTRDARNWPRHDQRAGYGRFLFVHDSSPQHHLRGLQIASRKRETAQARQ